jgi:hypothetical protein
MVAALMSVGCGSSVKDSRSSKSTDGLQLKPFSVALHRFDVQGNTVSYALSTTAHGRQDSNLTNNTDIKFLCSVNGSEFKNCFQAGKVPAGLLRVGLNSFQARAVVAGREAETDIYHEFTLGTGGVDSIR